MCIFIFRDIFLFVGQVQQYERFVCGSFLCSESDIKKSFKKALQMYVYL